MPQRKVKSDFSKLAGELRGTFRYVWCPCFTRIYNKQIRRYGVTSVRFRILLPPMVPTQGQYPMKKSLGVNWEVIRLSKLLNPTQRSWHHWYSPSYSDNKYDIRKNNQTMFTKSKRSGYACFFCYWPSMRASYSFFI